MNTKSSSSKSLVLLALAFASVPAFALPPRYYGPRVVVPPPRRPVVIAPIVPVPAPASPLRRAVEVQRALASRGYYPGPIDGLIGPGSRAAIRAFQADHRMVVSGEIDGPLLRALGL